jgi:hypothetical protein
VCTGTAFPSNHPGIPDNKPWGSTTSNQQLDWYLFTGKHEIIIITAMIHKDPEFEKFLSKWGVESESLSPNSPWYQAYFFEQGKPLYSAEIKFV